MSDVEKKENEPSVEKGKKRYKSTGAILKAGDFEALMEDLQEMKDKDNFKEFNKRTNKDPISQFDDLLFYFPQYAVKYEKNKDGEMEMTREILPGAMETLKFMLENGANPNAYMKNGENTYLKACEVPNAEILGYLINNPYQKVDLTHTDGMGNTGLWYATMAQSTDVIEYLVKECGVDINAKNFLSNDQTVMHYACGHGKEKSFDKLIELGANPTIKDIYGYEPFEMILPAYDEDTIDEYDQNDPEDVAELQKWKVFYDKVVNITQEYKKAHKTKLKTKF